MVWYRTINNVGIVGMWILPNKATYAHIRWTEGGKQHSYDNVSVDSQFRRVVQNCVQMGKNIPQLVIRDKALPKSKKKKLHFYEIRYGTAIKKSQNKTTIKKKTTRKTVTKKKIR